MCLKFVDTYVCMYVCTCFCLCHVLLAKALAELKSQFASKEQSLRYTEKSLKREAREKKGLEQQLKSAEHTVDVLTRSVDLGLSQCVHTYVHTCRDTGCQFIQHTANSQLLRLR